MTSFASNSTPNFDRVLEQLFTTLVSGDRRGTRDIVDAVYAAGLPVVDNWGYWGLQVGEESRGQTDQQDQLVVSAPIPTLPECSNDCEK